MCVRVSVCGNFEIEREEMRERRTPTHVRTIFMLLQNESNYKNVCVRRQFDGKSKRRKELKEWISVAMRKGDMKEFLAQISIRIKILFTISYGCLSVAASETDQNICLATSVILLNS